MIAPLLDYLAARNDLRLLGPRGAERPCADGGGGAGPRGRAGVRGAGPRRHRLLGAAISMPCGRWRRWGSTWTRACCGCRLVHYTSAEEVARLIAALDAVL